MLDNQSVLSNHYNYQLRKLSTLAMLTPCQPTSTINFTYINQLTQGMSTGINVDVPDPACTNPHAFLKAPSKAMQRALEPHMVP